MQSPAEKTDSDVAFTFSDPEVEDKKNEEDEKKAEDENKQEETARERPLRRIHQ